MSMRDVTASSPEDALRSIMRSSQVGIYSGLPLATIVAYDAGELPYVSHTSSTHVTPACTLNKEVLFPSRRLLTEANMVDFDRSITFG